MRLATAWILPAVVGLYAFPACTTIDCDDVCPPDLQRCDGDLLQVCTTDLQGCRVWEEQDCAASDLTCEEGASNTASCTGSTDTDTDTDTCDDECSTAGEERCEGDTIEACTADSDGCLAWSQTEDCTDTDTDTACVDASGGNPSCTWAPPTMGSPNLSTCPLDPDVREPKTGDVECPGDTDTSLIVDFYEIPGVATGDCVWAKADNLGSALGSDLFMLIVRPNGDYAFFDDETPCSITSPWACPEGAVTAPADTVYLAIGQFEGAGCATGVSDPYQLFVSLNGDPVTPVRVANDLTWAHDMW